MSKVTLAIVALLFIALAFAPKLGQAQTVQSADPFAKAPMAIAKQPTTNPG